MRCYVGNLMSQGWSGKGSLEPELPSSAHHSPLNWQRFTDKLVTLGLVAGGNYKQVNSVDSSVSLCSFRSEWIGSLPYRCFRSILEYLELQWKPLKVTLWKVTRGMWHDLRWCPDLEFDDTILCDETQKILWSNQCDVYQPFLFPVVLNWGLPVDFCQVGTVL